MPTTNNLLNWDEATQAVEQAQSVLVVTHVSPDGDAIGSLLAAAIALRERGKNVDVAVDGGVPDFLEFVPGAQTVMPVLTAGEWDVMISVDASDEERTGDTGIYGRAHSRTVINIDHHPTNTLFGDIYLVMPDAVSTTEVLYEWLLRMRHPIGLDLAVALLTGLVSDTRGFRTSNVRSSTLEIAQQLMEAGASLPEITARALETVPYSMIELWKYALASVELKSLVISASITRDDLKRARLREMTDGGLASMLLTADQARIAVVFKELPENKVEISLRSKPGYDVSQVALDLGGGGHRQASGATVAGTLDEVKASVMPLLYEAVRQGAPVVT